MSILANEDREASRILSKNSGFHKSFRTISFIVDDIYNANYRSWVYWEPAIPYLAAGRQYISDNGGYPYVFGGFALDDSFDLPLCSKLGLSIQDYYSPLVNSNKIFEFNAKSDLNAMAIYMGAKPGNRVRMILNGVTRQPLISFGQYINLVDIGGVYTISFREVGPNKAGQGYYFLYPYRSWDYLSSTKLPIGQTVYTEYPKAVSVVSSYRDPILGGNLYKPALSLRGTAGMLSFSNSRRLRDDYRGNDIEIQFYSDPSSTFYPYTKHPSLGGGQLPKDYIKPYSMAQMLSPMEDFYVPKQGLYSYDFYSIFPNAANSDGLYLGKLGSDYSKIIKPNQYLETDSVLALMTIESNTTTVITSNNNNNNVYNVNNVARPPVPTLTATPTQTPTGTGTPRSTPTNTPTKTPTPSVTPTKPGPTPTPSETPVNRGVLATIRDVNNPPYKFTTIDSDVKILLAQGVGSVSLPYSIGKYEITNTEYAEFLNAIGQNNANNVYRFETTPGEPPKGITVSGNSGSYVYSVVPGHANKPVVSVSWLSAARYCNWLHNNKPVDATGGAVNNGSYDLTVSPIKRSPSARYWIPSVDEWVKAGFYNPTTGGYYVYGTKSNTIPQKGSGGTSNNGAVYGLNAFSSSIVGSYPNSTSHYGLYDISGNIREWTDTFYDKDNTIITNSNSANADVKSISIESIGAGNIGGTGPGLGFRIATITNLSIPEQTYIFNKKLEDPNPFQQTFFPPSYHNEIKLGKNQNDTGSVRYYRLVASANPIGKLTKPIYIGKDKEALAALQNQNITFAFDKDAEQLVEYRSDCDLYRVASDMGAKPGDFVQLEVTYVFRPPMVVEYIDTDKNVRKAIVPYRSHNPLGEGVSLDKFFGPGDTISEGAGTYIINNTNNLNFLKSLYPDKISFENYRGIPSIILSFDRLNNNSKYTTYNDKPYVAYTTGSSYSVGPLRDYGLVNDAFKIIMRSPFGIDWINKLERQMNYFGDIIFWNQDRGDVSKREQLKNASGFWDFLKYGRDQYNSFTYFRRKMRTTNFALYYASYFANGYYNNILFLLEQMDEAIGRYELSDKFSILVRMRTAKKEKDLDVFLTTQSVSAPVRKKINTNDLFFISNPNYNSGIKDTNHLNEYVLNPGNVKLISTIDGNRKPSLLAKTKYVINNNMLDRKIIVVPSSSYTIEKYKNDIYTITFNNNVDGPVEISYALGDSGFGVTTSTPSASLIIQKYTVNVSKLKSIASFTKSFWLGGSITAYTNEKLIINPEYLKYKPELSKYRFKVFYRMLAGPSAGNSWIEIASDELDNFTSEYKYQILIQSDNLNPDVLFPGEGSEANPGYSNYGANTSMNFIVNVIPKSTEIRVAGINLSSNNVVGAKLSSTTNSNITTVSLDIPMNFDKQIEIVLSHFSASDKDYLKITDPEFTITNVAGCNKDYVSLEYWSNSYGYDQKNPQNFSKKLNVPTATNPGMDAYQSSKGRITILCKIPATQGYGAASATIIINWTIVPSKDIMEPISLPILYTGDDASMSSSFGVSLSSDSDSKTKQTKTITVSDNRILQIIRDNTSDSYSIQTPKVDTSDASILNALKTASITISTSGNKYYLPVKETIPVKIYPNNARLTSVASNKFAYVTSGISHFLGIRGDGKLFVWGTNTKGVFAGSDFVQYGANVILHPENKKWVQVETYGYNVYAIDIEGTLWGWGGNENASLGVGRDGVINTPTKILPNLKWKDIACGFNHAIGLTDDGKVYGWGDGTFLQNGCGSKTGTSVNTNLPTLIKNVGEVDNNGFVGALKVSCGPYSSWVIDKDSYIWAFGDLNGMITNVATFKPTATTFSDRWAWGTDFKKIGPNVQAYLAPLTHHTINHSLYRLKIVAGRDNIIFTIPNNLKHKWHPHKVKAIVGLHNIPAINISASANHVIALTTGGGRPSITAWGNNIWNQCFITNPPNKYYVQVYEFTPVNVTPKIEDGSFIAASPGQSIFIDTSDRLWVMGRNVSGELSGFYNANATYYQTLRNIPGQYSVVTANATGGFTEIK